MLSIYYNNNEDAQILAGKCLRLEAAVNCIKIQTVILEICRPSSLTIFPFWAELGSTPSQKVSLMSEWETKMEAIINETLEKGNQSGRGSFMDVGITAKCFEKNTKSNNCRSLAHGGSLFPRGVSFHPYQQFEKLFKGNDLNFFEIYNASEGFWNARPKQLYSIITDAGLRYFLWSFIPMDQPNRDDTEIIIPLSEIELGKSYAMVISTNAGLWRYKIGIP